MPQVMAGLAALAFSDMSNISSLSKWKFPSELLAFHTFYAISAVIKALALRIKYAAIYHCHPLWMP
jgi:hypothetical protein